MKPIVTPLFTAATLIYGVLNLPLAIAAENPDPIYTVTTSSQSTHTALGGTVIPWKTVNLSAQMPGDVKSIAGSEGDFFKKGTILVTQDTGALQAKRRSAEAQLASARAGLSNAKIQYQRELQNPNSQANSMMGGLPAVMGMMTDPVRNASSRGGNRGIDRSANLHQYRVGIETAQNQINQALAGIKELDENLINASSIAPFDGTILKKMAEVGDIIQPGMPIIVFGDTSRMQIQIEVPNRLVNKLTVGQKLSARLDGDKTDIEVKVSRIFPMAEQGAHTTTVKLDLPISIAARAGMYASVKIGEQSETSQALPVIPASSIVWRGSLPAVFLVKEDNHLKMQLIRKGAPSTEGYFSVISGLKEGDRILATANSSTRSGQTVTTLVKQASPSVEELKSDEQ
ncbi:MAG: efflux RND transporter periplasmic adaptor subunit [Gammaproteobacteria bacterium]|nr:efflux RND transporter periplasmic adaptor subunit [Gammaproteobacteria bacterium]